VRNFFDSTEVHNEFIELKLRHLKDSELQNKFSPKHVINWISVLKSKPVLTGVFTTSFVNYITQNDTKLFPRYLIDSDVNIIRKEVISYYYNLFPTTEAYRAYVLEDQGKDEVDSVSKDTP
jgi:hypothetical protein